MNVSILSHTRNRYGIALFNVVFILIFIGALLASGAKMYGSMVVRGKINESKGELERGVKMITAWAVKNGRLPATADYPGVFGATPVDAWGKSLSYIYDAGLTATATGGLCGRTSTILQNSGVSLAFALVSGGDDYSIETTANGTAATTSTAATTLALNPSDLYRAVTLEELKSKAGCYGTTGGRLRIVNNELPNVCAGSTTYPATLFSDGGVPGYTWALLTTPPWLAVNPATGVLSPNTSITNTAGTYQVTARLTDSQSNSVERTYNLKVNSCIAPNGAVITFKDNFPVQVIGGGNKVEIVQDSNAQSVTILTVGSGSGTGCQWYNNKMTLGAKEIMKAYVEFTLDNDTSSDSGDFGDGFTFALLNDGTNINTTCGANGKALGYDGIAGSHVVEFDSVQDSNGDPLTNNDIRNHVAILETNASHAGNSCFQYPTQGSCQYDSTTKWFENGVKHNARIELDEQTLTMKVWIDCGECTPWDTINNRIGFPTPETSPNIVKQLSGMTKSFYFGFTTSTGAHAKMVQTIKLEHFNLGIYNK